MKEYCGTKLATVRNQNILASFLMEIEDGLLND
jgi:hypothetical protein